MELYLCRDVSADRPAGVEEEWMRFPSSENQEFSIGRSIDCKVRLLSSHVSRNHALLKKSDDGKCWIKDQGSLLGTHINGIRLSQAQWHAVSEGDQVEFGKHDDEEVLKSMRIDDRFLYSVKLASPKELDEKLPGPRSHKSAMFKRASDSTSKTKIVPKTMQKKRPNDKMNKHSHNNFPEINSEIEQENKRLKLQLKEKELALMEEVETRNQAQKAQNLLVSKLRKDFRNKFEQTEGHENENCVPIGQETFRHSKVEHEKEGQLLKENEATVRKKLQEQQITRASIGNRANKDRIVEKNEMDIISENKRLKQELEEKDFALREERDARSKRLKEEQRKMAERLEREYKSKLEQKEEELEMRIQLEKDIAVEECKATLEAVSKPTSLDSVVDTMENELQCSICSELFIVSTTLNCSHTFCEFCINQWRAVRNVCPVCRQIIGTVTRSLVLDNYIEKVMESVSGERKETRRKVIEERKKLVEADKKPLPKSTRNRGRARVSSNRGTVRRGQGSSSRIGAIRSSSPIVIPDESSESANDESIDSDESHDSYSDGSLNPYPYRGYDPFHGSYGYYSDSDDESE